LSQSSEADKHFDAAVEKIKQLQPGKKKRRGKNTLDADDRPSTRKSSSP